MDISVDYYELLHVRPGAPAAVIKASYRTMLQKLNHHPDRGGDVGFAQLLNEAAQTLCDPETRARYDALRQQFQQQAPKKPQKSRDKETAQSSWGEPGGAPDNSQTVSPTNKQYSDNYSDLPTLPAKPSCHFCHTIFPATTQFSSSLYAKSSRCPGCNGARTPIAQVAESSNDELRRIHRQNHRTPASLHSQWPSEGGRQVTLIDFSPTGCALQTDNPLARDSVVMIENSMFNTICSVRHCKPTGQSGILTVGVEFITLDMSAAPGALLNATA